MKNKKRRSQKIDKKSLSYDPQDSYFKKAKEQGYVARSVFKLEEMDKKLKLYKVGQKILDLGCAPGSWLQYASQKVGPSGLLYGIDLEPVKIQRPNIKTFVGDLFEVTAHDPRFEGQEPFDLIQSDAMSKTTGIAESDCARSLNLVEHALKLAQKGALKKEGTFIAKVFEGPGFSPFFVEFKKLFSKASVNKPEAIRPGSREIYIVGQGFRPKGH